MDWFKFLPLNSLISFSRDFLSSGVQVSTPSYCKGNAFKKANILLNGNEVNDYPVTASSAHVSIPFIKFLENTNKQMNGLLGRTLNPREFETQHFILSATFDPDQNGVLSFQFDFDSVNNADLVLVVCGIYDRAIKIDGNRSVQIV